jgi:LEA14-like dessication related protein
MIDTTRNRNLALALISLVLVACASTGLRIETPSVTLQSIRLEEADLSRQRFVLSFGVQNPNPFPLPIRAIRYRVMLDNQRFAGGETVSDFTIPSRGDGNFSISVETDLLRSGTQLAGLLRNATRESVDYELAGDLTVDIPFAPPLEYAQRGTIMVQSLAF